MEEASLEEAEKALGLKPPLPTPPTRWWGQKGSWGAGGVDLSVSPPRQWQLQGLSSNP